MAKIVVIDNNAVQRILTDAKLMQSLPTVSSVARTPVTKTCGGCGGGKKRTTTTVDYMTVKRAIASLPKSKLDELKAKLGADKLQISYAGLQGVSNFVV